MHVTYTLRIEVKDFKKKLRERSQQLSEEQGVTGRDIAGAANITLDHWKYLKGSGVKGRGVSFEAAVSIEKALGINLGPGGTPLRSAVFNAAVENLANLPEGMIS